MATTSPGKNLPREFANHSGSRNAGLDCWRVRLIKAFSETDQTEDLKKIEVPTLVIQGDADQIVPIDDSGRLSAKIVKNATLKVIEGAPHGLCTTHADEINQELLAFLQK